MPPQDVWKFPPVFYRTLALWGCCPALTPPLYWIAPSRASGTADHVRSLDDLFSTYLSLPFLFLSRLLSPLMVTWRQQCVMADETIVVWYHWYSSRPQMVCIKTAEKLRWGNISLNRFWSQNPMQQNAIKNSMYCCLNVIPIRLFGSNALREGGRTE